MDIINQELKYQERVGKERHQGKKRSLDDRIQLQGGETPNKPRNYGQQERVSTPGKDKRKEEQVLLENVEGMFCLRT